MHFEHWISHVASRSPEKTAIHFHGESISYARLENLISRLAWLLRYRYEVAAGDRLVHLALNSPTFPALLFACARIGAMLVPLNYRLAQPELAYLLRDADPKVLFVDRDFQAALLGDELVSARCRFVAINGAIDTVECDDLEMQLGGAEVEPSQATSRDSAEALLVVYTSGTTGRPKGVMLNQHALRWNALNSQHMHAFTADDHVLTVLPFFHVGGINIQTLPALHCGATVTLLPTFDPEQVLRTIVEARPTHSVMVPTQMRAVAALPQWGNADISNLRAVTTGSTIVDTSLLELWEKRGVRTLQVYGCTESCPIAICQSVSEQASPLGSVGKAAKHCAARVVDEDDCSTANGVCGEIQIRGPSIMSGYWRKPDETAATVRNGWLATGDIGYRDEDGNYFVVDRIKHMIISGGENIYPAEIEQLLQAHPDIDEVAVLGIPDSKWGEIVTAAIVPTRNRSIDEAGILEYLEERIARFKLPRRFVFGTELPRNSMGKVDLEELRSRLMASQLIA